MSEKEVNEYVSKLDLFFVYMKNNEQSGTEEEESTKAQIKAWDLLAWLDFVFSLSTWEFLVRQALDGSYLIARKTIFLNI